jgi:hypothetical protein
MRKFYNAFKKLIRENKVKSVFFGLIILFIVTRALAYGGVCIGKLSRPSDKDLILSYLRANNLPETEYEEGCCEIDRKRNMMGDPLLSVLIIARRPYDFIKTSSNPNPEDVDKPYLWGMSQIDQCGYGGKKFFFNTMSLAGYKADRARVKSEIQRDK